MNDRQVAPTDTQIEARIEWWHRSWAADLSIWSALGWTEDEYARWLVDPQAVPHRALPDVCSLTVPAPTDTEREAGTPLTTRAEPRGKPPAGSGSRNPGTPTDTRERIEELFSQTVFTKRGEDHARAVKKGWDAALREVIDILDEAALGVGEDDPS